MPPRAAILVIDDEPIIRNTLGEFLRSVGHSVAVCADGLEALAHARKGRFDIALCDVNMPGLDGHDVVQALLRLDPEILCVLVTAYATVESAVEAFQRGAIDYLIKPVIFEDLKRKIERFVRLRELSNENQLLRRELHREADPGFVAGSSPAMRRVAEVCRKAGPSRSSVLITGEPGVGKETVARAIHRHGEAPNRPSRFLTFDCSACPPAAIESSLFGHRRGAFPGAERDREGVFASAGGGTVYLDEVSALPRSAQARLVRALEHGAFAPSGADESVPFSARVVAGSAKDLSAEVEAGRFRDDLFRRLQIVAVHLPPLRDRREDIPELAETFLRRHASALKKRIDAIERPAMAALTAAPWPGNLRELDNAMQRAAIWAEADVIRLHDLPADLAPPPSETSDEDDLSAAMQHFERAHIERVLRQAPDKKEAARRLNIGLSSLYRKIEALGIE